MLSHQLLVGLAVAAGPHYGVAGQLRPMRSINVWVRQPQKLLRQKRSGGLS